jgi:hypothetical protein
MPPGRESAARARWEEWVIAIAIAALFAIGVASIWGGSIRQWVGEQGAESERAPPVHPPVGPRL